MIGRLLAGKPDHISGPEPESVTVHTSVGTNVPTDVYTVTANSHR